VLDNVVEEPARVPKLVDHEERRQELVDAAWRVIHREGVEGATVREIAAEADCSPGSLRYYFPTQAELLAFAMELVAERVRERVEALEPVADVRAGVQRALEEVLPLDEERLTEMEIWIAFSARAQVDENLRRQREETHMALRQFIRTCIDALAGAGLMHRDHSRELETNRLHALVDGLALHGVTSPETMTPRRARRVLRAHLAALA
jgi:AcrR family transcriptional regulator